MLLPGKRWLLWTNSVGALLAVDRSVDTVFQYGYLVSSSYSKFDLTKKRTQYLVMIASRMTKQELYKTIHVLTKVHHLKTV